MTSKLSLENTHQLDKHIIFYEENHKYNILIDPESDYTYMDT